MFVRWERKRPAVLSLPKFVSTTPFAHPIASQRYRGRHLPLSFRQQKKRPTSRFLHDRSTSALTNLSRRVPALVSLSVCPIPSRILFSRSSRRCISRAEQEPAGSFGWPFSAT